MTTNGLIWRKNATQLCSSESVRPWRAGMLAALACVTLALTAGCNKADTPTAPTAVTPPPPAAAKPPILTLEPDTPTPIGQP